MLAMAVFAVTGKTWSLPMLKGSPDLRRTDSAGVFALGVFSGAASSCCAPVLAGVVTMSAVAPSLPMAAVIGLAYVFGMVFPLLVMTLVWDRSGLRQSRRIRGKDIRWSLWAVPYQHPQPDRRGGRGAMASCSSSWPSRLAGVGDPGRSRRRIEICLA
jgi:hypothetical protein